MHPLCQFICNGQMHVSKLPRCCLSSHLCVRPKSLMHFCLTSSMLAPSSSDACHDSTLSFTTLTCHDVTAEVDVANQAAGPCCVNRKRLQGSNAISESLESDSPKQMPRAMTALQSLQRLEMNPSRLMPLAGEVVHSCPHDAGGSNFDSWPGKRSGCQVSRSLNRAVVCYTTGHVKEAEAKVNGNTRPQQNRDHRMGKGKVDPPMQQQSATGVGCMCAPLISGARSRLERAP